MAENDSEIERRIKEYDKIDPSPSDRALYVYNLISRNAPDLTEWDITCFCAEYLGLVSAQAFPFLLSNARELAKMVYSIHYQERELSNDTNFRSSTISRNGKVDEEASSIEAFQNRNIS